VSTGQVLAGLLLGCDPHADVAQLVEHHLAKVRVAGSNPVVRSNEVPARRWILGWNAGANGRPLYDFAPLVRHDPVVEVVEAPIVGRIQGRCFAQKTAVGT
jgi:hypothetical protein